jgi:hypothetical protein
MKDDGTATKLGAHGAAATMVQISFLLHLDLSMAGFKNIWIFDSSITAGSTAKEYPTCGPFCG